MSTQHSGTLIRDSIAMVDQHRLPEPMPHDFMSYAECEAEARKRLAERHPEIGGEGSPGALWAEFCLIFATNVAYTCAAEATRRANGSANLAGRA